MLYYMEPLRADSRPVLLGMVAAVLAIIASLKLGTELHRLVAAEGFTAAIDLRLRYVEVDRWFAGLPVYTEFSRITYPPQTYVVLWPFMGWLAFVTARWLWAVTTVAALMWLCVLVVRESGAADRMQRAFAVLMVLSMNAVGVTIGNGQLIVHILPALVAGVLLLRRPLGGWGTDAAAAGLLLFALIKPTLTAPFVWVALFTTQRLRPLALTAAGYVLLTLFAASFQAEPVHTLLTQWAAQKGPVFSTGYGDLQSGLAAIGLDDWSMPASLLLFAALGVWTFRHRTVDPWILIGVAALVARFWTYHRVYDDALILLPMVALFRIATRRVASAADDAGQAHATVLLGIAIFVMLAPARLETAAPPLNGLFVGGHVTVWLVMLFTLARAARHPTAVRIQPVS